jgi:hypothetical protein
VTLPFSADAFFDVLAAYNAQLWPVAVLLWAATAWTFVMVLRGRASLSRFPAVLLVIQWTWSAVAYHLLFFTRINPVAWGFGVLFLFEATLLAWYARRQPLPFARVHSARGAFAATLIGYALAYPLLAVAGGHAYPRLPTFGVPCPTTILTIGFLIGAGRTFPRTAAVVPIAWSAIGGSASVLFGVWADLMMPVAAAALLVDVCVFRPRWTSVRASADERTQALPGDEVIPACMGSFTHAITIHRRPDEVWPWLVQMGAGSRAGWYSYDWLDNGRRPSAARIEPALQQVSVGTVFPALPGITDCFTLLAFEPERHLILGWSPADRGVLMTWAFVLERAAHESTRLIVRARGAQEYRFQGLPPWLTKPIVAVVHAVMQRKQLLGIARRVEARRVLEDAA